MVRAEEEGNKMFNNRKQYHKDLLDSRWIAIRNRILLRDDHLCSCGKPAEQVHHISYAESRKPWDSPENQLMSICRSCHIKLHRAKLFASEKLRFEVVKQFQLLFPQYSKTEGRGKMKQQQYQLVLNYMLDAADKFGETFYLSNRKVAEATGTSQKQASNIMHFFCRNFRVFETICGRKVKKEGGKFTSTPITYRILPVAPTQMQAVIATDWFKATCDLYLDELEPVDDRKGLPDGWSEEE